MIDKTISHYKILRKLGAGGQGDVYLAHDMDLDREVALKFLPPQYPTDSSALTRFKREAKAAAALNHPNIVTVHEIGTHEGKPFIAMEYVEGAPLRELIAAKTLSVKEAVALVIQVCDGLAKAHAVGVVHRDIKPENLILDREGRVRILDFGLARMGGVTTLTGRHVAIGTVRYMSPEQARGEEIDRRSDIFSLGVVLYEMVAGAPPFRGEFAEAILFQITSVDPPPLANFTNEVTPELQRVADKALAKDRSARYESAAEMATDLKRVIGDTAAIEAQRRKRQLIRYSVLSSVVGLVVFGMIVFKPWKLEFHPDQTATAESDRLAIMYFENVAEPGDPERWAEIATNLLITDLAESQHARVVSSQRLYDILKQKGHEGAKAVSRETATEVAREAGAKRMLVGSILRTVPRIEITSQIIDIKSGESQATQRIRGTEGEDIFSLIDRLSAEVRNDLGFTGEGDVAVADVTTRSVEAYRHYIEGRENMNGLRFDAARASFESAVRADSTFALAWIELTQPYLTVMTGITTAELERALAKARAHSNKVTQKERYYIEARAKQLLNDQAGAIAEWKALTEEFPDEKQAYYELSALQEDPDTSIAYLQKSLELDPSFKAAFSDLAYYYQRVGDIEKSRWAIDQYIRLAPNDGEGYRKQADLYGLTGEIDKAIASMQKAVEVEPSSWLGVQLCDLYFLTGDEVRARQCWNEFLKGTPVARAVVRYHMAACQHYRGHVDEAIQTLEQTVIANRLDGYDGRANSANHGYLSYLWALKGDWERSEVEHQKAMAENQKYEPLLEVWIRAERAAILAELHDVSRAEAQLLKVAELEPDGDAYWWAKCWVDMAAGRYDLACDAIEKLPNDRTFGSSYIRGLAYLRAKRYKESIAALSFCATMWNDGKTVDPDKAVQTHYYLGLAYEQTGEKKKAVEQFEKFADIWRDADLPAYQEKVADARARLSRLRGLRG